MERSIPRVCVKTSKGPEAYFEQNNPHPDPLPSDGRGNSQTRLSYFPRLLGTPTNEGRFNLSNPMGRENRPPPLDQTGDRVCPTTICNTPSLGPPFPPWGRGSG